MNIIRYKNLFSLLLILVLFYSCKKSSNEPLSNTIELEPELSIEQIEKNLISDANQYYINLSTGNTEKTITYLHQSNINYLKKEFPNENANEMLNEAIQEFSKSFGSTNGSLKVKVDIKVDSVQKKYFDSDYIVYLCKAKLKMFNNGGDSLVEKTYILGISEDKGNHFKFLQADDKKYLEEVLKVSFNRDIVKKIIN